MISQVLKLLRFTCTASVSFIYLQETEVVLPSNAKYFSWLHFYIQMLVISLLLTVQYRFFTLSNLSPEGSVRRFLLNAAALNFLAKARAVGAICEERRECLNFGDGEEAHLAGDEEEARLEGWGRGVLSTSPNLKLDKAMLPHTPRSAASDARNLAASEPCSLASAWAAAACSPAPRGIRSSCWEGTS